MKDSIIKSILLPAAAAALLLAEFSAPAQDTPLYRRGYTIEESTMPPSPEPASAVRHVDAKRAKGVHV